MASGPLGQQCSDGRFLSGLPTPRGRVRVCVSRVCVCVHSFAAHADTLTHTHHSDTHAHTFETYQVTHSALSHRRASVHDLANWGGGGEGERGSPHVLGPANENEFNRSITNRSVAVQIAF